MHALYTYTGVEDYTDNESVWHEGEVCRLGAEGFEIGTLTQLVKVQSAKRH